MSRVRAWSPSGMLLTPSDLEPWGPSEAATCIPAPRRRKIDTNLQALVELIREHKDALVAYYGEDTTIEELCDDV